MYQHYSNKFQRKIVVIHHGEYYASLAGDNSSGSIMSNSGCYGMYAMQLVINAMLKLGARKQNLRAGSSAAPASCAPVPTVRPRYRAVTSRLR